MILFVPEPLPGYVRVEAVAREVVPRVWYPPERGELGDLSGSELAEIVLALHDELRASLVHVMRVTVAITDVAAALVDVRNGPVPEAVRNLLLADPPSVVRNEVVVLGFVHESDDDPTGLLGTLSTHDGM